MTVHFALHGWWRTS
ncbi:trp operon leader peptide [Enterobacter hormaechei]